MPNIKKLKKMMYIQHCFALNYCCILQAILKEGDKTPCGTRKARLRSGWGWAQAAEANC